MDTKLGIIIPTYDSLDTLQVLIGQLFERTTAPFELIIVEDGRKKATIDYLRGLLNVHVIYHKKNKGIAPSWNDGLRKAQKLNCTHFAILNDDIEVPEGWWEPCAEALKKANVVSLTDPCPSGITGWFFVIDRECLETVGYFDESFAPYLGEDDDYYYRILDAHLKIQRISLPVIHHGSHTMKKIEAQDPQAYKEAFNTAWHKLRAKHPTRRLMTRT